jgi:hypothetical protein
MNFVGREGEVRLESVTPASLFAKALRSARASKHAIRTFLNKSYRIGPHYMYLFQ